LKAACPDTVAEVILAKRRRSAVMIKAISNAIPDAVLHAAP
jgi:hypothetical protein